MDLFKLFIPLRKVEELPTGDLKIAGTLIREEVDKADEIFDFETSKPYVEDWTRYFSESTKAMGVEESAGNMRVMHKAIIAGKFTHIGFDDALKSVVFEGEVTDPEQKRNVLKGLYTGVSMGGSYVKKWPDEKLGKTRYTGQPSEGSLADMPCVPSATFTLRRADGAEELRKFVEPSAPEPVQKQDAEPTPAPDGSLDAAIAAADAAMGEMKSILKELGAIEGDPDPWTLDSLLQAIRSMRSIMLDLRSKQVDAALAASAGKTDDIKKAVDAERAELLTKFETVTKDLTALRDEKATLQKAVEEMKAANVEQAKKIEELSGKVETIGKRPAYVGSPPDRSPVELALEGGATGLDAVRVVMEKVRDSGKFTQREMEDLGLKVSATIIQAQRQA